MDFQFQQVPVTSNDDISSAGDGAFEDAVVGFVGKDSQAFFRFDYRDYPADTAHRRYRVFLIPAELYP